MSRRLFELFACACLVVTPAGLALAQGGMPAPGPEHEKMAYFAGAWQFQGEVKESPMGPGGSISLKEDCEMFDGGFVLICRSEGKGPMGLSKGISLMTYDTEKKSYTYTAVEKDMPMFTAFGKESGGTWSWHTEMKMGATTIKTKVTIKQQGTSSYTFDMELAADDGPYAQVMQGKYTKAGT